MVRQVHAAELGFHQTEAANRLWLKRELRKARRGEEQTALAASSEFEMMSDVRDGVTFP